MMAAGTRLCFCTGFRESRVPSTRASNICMGKGFVVYMVSENRCQGPLSGKLLQISTDVIDAHIHCQILGVSLVRAGLF